MPITSLLTVNEWWRIMVNKTHLLRIFGPKNALT